MLENDLIVDEGGEEETPSTDETIDWKARAEELEQKASKQRETTKVLKEELSEAKKAEAPEKTEEEKGFNYGEKAFLQSHELKITPEEFDYVYKETQSTGKDIEYLLASKYFQEQLKSKRDSKSAKDALPKGSKRSGGATTDQVSYWVAKGELPPVGDTELRRKVVNARWKTGGTGSQFTKNPVV